MTQEDKELLLRDLSVRLPYRVKTYLTSIECGELVGEIYAVYPDEERVIVDNLNKSIAPINVRCGGFNIEHNTVKPYLRPMSSMTEEERTEFYKVGGLMSHKVETNTYVLTAFSPEAYDWLNAHHFDYRGLIEKGLAIEALEGMYNKH